MWLPYMDVVTLSVPNIVMKLMHTRYLEHCVVVEGCAFEMFARVVATTQNYCSLL